MVNGIRLPHRPWLFSCRESLGKGGGEAFTLSHKWIENWRKLLKSYMIKQPYRGWEICARSTEFLEIIFFFILKKVNENKMKE